MDNNSSLRVQQFFQNKEKVDKYLASPRKVYGKVQRITRLLSNTQPMDLFIKVCGLEDCQPSKLPTSGPKNLNSIHFILQGEGTFILEKDKKFVLTEGSIFCAMKNIENTYYPNSENPWSYIFIGLGGILADSIIHYLGLDNNHCVISSKRAKHLRDSFFAVYNAFSEEQATSFRVLAALYKLIAELEAVCCKKKKDISDVDRHIYKALEVIRNNGCNVTADIVAKACGLNRIYLSRIMKARVGLTLQEIIIATRLFVAQDYLKFMDIKTPISEISRLVGYSDVKHFSKLFKSVFGVTPSEYKKQVDMGIDGNK